MNHDQGFKHLLSAYFLEFLDLFAPEVRAFAEPDSLVFLDKEVFADLPDGQRGEADLLGSLRVADSERIFLVHLEHEAQYRNHFERRMFFYYARLLERHGLDIYPLAVLSYPRRRTPQPDRFVVEFPCLRPLVFQFQVIELNLLRWRDYLQPGWVSPGPACCPSWGWPEAREPRSRPLPSRCWSALSWSQLDWAFSFSSWTAICL